MIPYAQLTSSLPSNGTNAIHRITIGGSPTTGTWKLRANGKTSAAITWSNNNTTLLSRIQTALDAIYAAGNTTAAAASLTAGVGTIDVTFSGAFAKMPVPAIMTVLSNTLDGSGTVAVASQTTGVFATFRGAAAGALLIYTGVTPPVTYVNVSGTQFSPTWQRQNTATVTNAITAHAGGGQGSAVALTSAINRITTVGTAADSVKLPAAKAGMIVWVINAAAANAAAIFPSSTEIINALSADASISIAANKTMAFVCAVDGTWNSILTA